MTAVFHVITPTSVLQVVVNVLQEICYLHLQGGRQMQQISKKSW